ncbi:MAG: hypothetical protein ACXV8V_11675 [Ilumatobacteraceae bacterium]
MARPTRPEDVDRRAQRAPTSPPGGTAVYGLGLIGAAVWFWRQATGVGEHVIALLKALVWPAFLVYDAFKALRG